MQRPSSLQSSDAVGHNWFNLWSGQWLSKAPQLRGCPETSDSGQEIILEASLCSSFYLTEEKNVSIFK